MQPEPPAPPPPRGLWHLLRRRSWLRVLGLTATGALTAALTASSVAPAAGSPTQPALPVNTDLLGATGALPVEASPADPTVFVPAGAAAPTEGARVLAQAAALPTVGTPMPAVGPDRLGIPARVLAAYQRGESTMTRVGPGCHLRWWMLAGIGRIEASHAEDGRLDAHGVAVPPIFGPVLNGQPGMAAVRDTDGGHLDADPVWDRAVGPMQFLPGSWEVYGAGGNPQNVDDAALAAARYLCAGGVDLSKAPRLVSAIFNYNHSDAYVAAVLGWAHAYERGVIATPAAALLAQQIHIATLRAPPAAALRALAAPARSRKPTGVAKPASSPGRTKPTTAAAPIAGPVTTSAAPAGGSAPAGQPAQPTQPAAGVPAPPSAPAPPAGTATVTAPPCQPLAGTPVAPASPGPGVSSAPATPVPTPVQPPAVPPVPTFGQPGPVTDLGTISVISCTLASLTRPDGTVMTLDLSLLPRMPVVGARVQVTGWLSPDGRLLLATTSTPAP